MDASPVPRTLDELAAELSSAVSRAVAANADAALTAAFSAMSTDLETVTEAIQGAASVLYDASDLALEPDERADLEQKRNTLAERLETVRTRFGADPTALRRGPLWRETKAAFDALQTSLDAHRDAAYKRMLDPYAHEDRQQFATLPPSTPGIDDYLRAIEQFEHAQQRPPRSPSELARSIAAGQRLRDLREQTERDAVPEQHRAPWRRLLGSGLPLDELNEDFRLWLRERGLEDEVVLRLHTQ